MGRLSFLALLCVATPAAAEIFATTTTFQITGSSSTLDCGTYSATNDRYIIHADAVVRSHKSTVFVINRFLQDNVLVLDAANNYAVVTQYSTGNGSNPQDIQMVGPQKAYVTRYEETSLWIVNAFTGYQYGHVDLGALADGDGIPEMSQMVQVGDFVYVALQNLDRGAGFQPTGLSTVAVIDTNSDTLVDQSPKSGGVDGIPLQLQNPVWEMHYSPPLARILLVSPGQYLMQDGGLEALNPFSGSTELLLTEANLGGDLLAAVVASETLGYAIRGDTSYNTCVVPFNPTDGSTQTPLLCSNGFKLTDLALYDGKLYVADRTPGNDGVRIYDATTQSLLAGPIDLGLPPFDLEPVTPSAVATPISRSVRLAASPNPAAGPTTFTLQGVHTSTPLEIFDLRGRHLRTIPPSVSADGWTYRWDGEDGSGQPVAAGVYRARAGSQSIRIARLK